VADEVVGRRGGDKLTTRGLTESRTWGFLLLGEEQKGEGERRDDGKEKKKIKKISYSPFLGTAEKK